MPHFIAKHWMSQNCGCRMWRSNCCSQIWCVSERFERAMKVSIDNDTILVTGVTELVAANSFTFRDQLRATMCEGQRYIEIDLSDIHFIDSSGLGALIGLHKSTRVRNGVVRLLNPTPQVEQILKLTRTNRLFEVIKRN